MKKTGLIFAIMSFIFLSAASVNADIVSYWSGYTQSVQTKVMSNFLPPKTKEPLAATVSLNINKDGSEKNKKMLSVFFWRFINELYKKKLHRSL